MPLDWDRPNGRTIRLALIRHLASRPEERIGTLFINPGGPGDTGVGLVSGDPDGVDAFGGGRFDVVSWDPRGTNASTRVRCFRSQRSESRFWAGASIPATNAASKRFEHKIADLARRCGEVSGWLLPHISTADTARDLDHLRVLMGEEKLTYVGLSYGTLLGQTYANLFPDRIRAMLLNGVVDATKDSKGAEARTASDVSSADPVFARFLVSLRRRRTGALRARRWPPHRGRALPATGRAGKARADPGPGGAAAALVAPGAQLRRYVALTVPAAQGSKAVAGKRGGYRCRAARRRIGARERGERLHRARRLGRRRRPRRRSPAPTRPPTGNYGPGRR